MTKTFKNCQSCGMPMKKSPQGGGTTTNGSISGMYCAYCYEKGAFTQPDWTLNQMKQLSKIKMKEIGIPGFLAGIFTKGMGKLERWKNQ